MPDAISRSSQWELPDERSHPPGVHQVTSRLFSTRPRDPATGKRKRRWRTFIGTKRQAQVECARLIAEIHGGTYVDPAKMIVGVFLERWLAHIQPQVSPKSFERYSEIVRKNIVPALGGVMLSKLQPVQIAQAYGRALADGRRDGAGGLSARRPSKKNRGRGSFFPRPAPWLERHGGRDVVRVARAPGEPTRAAVIAGGACATSGAIRHPAALDLASAPQGPRQ
jgi:Phage integrase, N-terminal SAM-like domain